MSLALSSKFQFFKVGLVNIKARKGLVGAKVPHPSRFPKIELLFGRVINYLYTLKLHVSGSIVARTVEVLAYRSIGVSLN